MTLCTSPASLAKSMWNKYASIPEAWSIHDGTKHITRTLEFLFVDRPTDHNILLGQPAAPSTLHGVLKFSTSGGPTMVVAKKLSNRRDARRERKHETRLYQIKFSQKVEEPHRWSATAQVRIHKSRKRQRDIFSQLTSPPQKGASTGLRMTQPEYGAILVKQKSV
uniref:Uncharacterized protein n=1 Tax=Lactuca sativa TaxID=4236 RepID=A0A9R1W8C6_LACSA|nr:hypothetical protein LSAT_V11C300102640 [Lactuca sativa]